MRHTKHEIKLLGMMFIIPYILLCGGRCLGLRESPSNVTSMRQQRSGIQTIKKELPKGNRLRLYRRKDVNAPVKRVRNIRPHGRLPIGQRPLNKPLKKKKKAMPFPT